MPADASGISSRRLLGWLAICLIATGPASAQETDASILAGVQPPAGFQIELFAREPAVRNPVSFCFDEHNRMYVIEGHRMWTGATDIRRHMHLLEADLACRTVDDRIRMLWQALGDDAPSYTEVADRIVLLEDSDDDGKADRVETFHEGQRTIAQGLAGGVLAHRGNVYYADVPNLWRLQDNDGDGLAESHRSLHYGYGVHMSFIGHDLHGLTIGPDGKLYFSMGDRGFHVVTEDATASHPDTGGVLRCNLDGSNLEVVAYGMRNPQELAFDAHGNLWTVDNNCDRGDAARLIWILDGSDAGWRINYQTQPDPCPWLTESLWEMGDHAASQLPPIGYVGHGPSGLAYYPGTGMPDHFNDRFFMCNFPTDILSFRVQPKGASFEVLDIEPFIGNLWATDIAFGLDGGVYFSDWVHGWTKPEKGRLFHVFNTEASADPTLIEIQTLLATGVDHLPPDELVLVLRHRDMRLRQAAQFALAKLGGAVVPMLEEVLKQPEHPLARLHAIWALGQIAPQAHNALPPLRAVLADDDVEVRCQAAKTLGDQRDADAVAPLMTLLHDDQPRVRVHAGIALSRVGNPIALQPIVDMLRVSDDDPYLRHAGVMVMTRCGDGRFVEQLIDDESPAVQLAALVAMRRMGNPNIARFLDSSNPRLVLEAARAINDVPINEATEYLAHMTDQDDIHVDALRRAMYAAFRVGDANRLADAAANEHVDPTLRVMAAHLLGLWSDPPNRDVVTGAWQPMSSHAIEPAHTALAGLFAELHPATPADVTVEAVRAISKLRAHPLADQVHQVFADTAYPPTARAAALGALGDLADERLLAAVQSAFKGSDEAVTVQALQVLDGLDLPNAATVLEGVIVAEGPIRVRQAAAKALGKLGDRKALAALQRCFERAMSDRLPPAVHLEIFEAIEAGGTLDLKQLLIDFDNVRKNRPIAERHIELLEGGDVEAGRAVFLQKPQAQCFRCHQLNGQGGVVGPDLTRIGAQRKPHELLESILTPNSVIEPAYQQFHVSTANGDYFGRVTEESDESLTLLTPQGEELVILKVDITDQRKTLSAMPGNLAEFLTRRELRDLVAFLSSLN